MAEMLCSAYCCYWFDIRCFVFVSNSVQIELILHLTTIIVFLIDPTYFIDEAIEIKLIYFIQYFGISYNKNIAKYKFKFVTYKTIKLKFFFF